MEDKGKGRENTEILLTLGILVFLTDSSFHLSASSWVGSHVYFNFVLVLAKIAPPHHTSAHLSLSSSPDSDHQ